MVASLILSAAYLATVEGIIVGFAINLVASAIISRVFAPDAPSFDGGLGGVPNPGNRATVPPAADNKLPIVYGTAWVGGAVTDMTITSNNQQIYYVISLSEVTNTETGGTPDTFTFGDIFYSGKKVIFDGTDLTKVIALRDMSTGLDDTTVNGKINIYLYKNGSSQPVNTANSAINVLSASDLVYKWDNTKLMSNTVFAIVRLTYSVTANVRGLDQIRFQVTNSRKAPGDCFLDYLTSSRYGAALTTAQIDTTSLTALNTYSNTLINYIDYSGFTQTLKRFQFDGTLDTNQPIMTNIQLMASSCDCLVKYNEITAQWGVIVQQPTYTVAMALDNSNIVSGIQISPTDISNSFNIAEVKFPDGSQQDSFASVTFDLAVINPSLLYSNEPVNKQQITLQLVNGNVRAQLLANRFLESCREDLQVQLTINFSGIQLEAGDIVSITNTNYGWVAKLFRVAKVTEKFGDDGSVTAALSLLEFNPAVYDDASITQFTPAPNTGLSSPTTFGTIPIPVIGGALPSAPNPSFQVTVTSSSAGIVQYAEIWYSAFATPTAAQRIFAGTTAIQSNGNPYDPSTAMPIITLTDIPSGNWYFFSRMVNQLGSSDFSAASSLLQWRPTTFTYAEKYLIVAYADSITGTGLSASPTGKSYYGLYNSTNQTFSSVASNYTWYLAQPTFGTAYFLAYTNRGGRTFSFGIAPASQASGTGSFVPTTTYDSSIWAALAGTINYIDLDVRTGQVTKTATTTTGGGQLVITNNNDGTMVGGLQPILDFGGASSYTGTASTITIDIYGRVLGLIPPDDFNYTSQEFTATAGQTVFTPTRASQTIAWVNNSSAIIAWQNNSAAVISWLGSKYLVGQDWVFKNGLLLDPTSDYTETKTAVTLNTACAVNDQIAIFSFVPISNSITYEDLGLVYASGTGTSTVTFTNLTHQLINVGDKLTFANTGSPTQYTVQSVNYATSQITFTGTFTALAGAIIYRYRAAGSAYPAYSRFGATVSAQSTYTPTTWQFVSGSEVIFLNGVIVNDQDYDLVANTINNFPSTITGDLQIFSFAPNNQGLPAGLPALATINTAVGVSSYNYSYNTLAFELYNNGCLLNTPTDYTTSTGTYTLTTAPTSNVNVLNQQTFNRTGAA
jgi:hypothetical protein